MLTVCMHACMYVCTYVCSYLKELAHTVGTGKSEIRRAGCQGEDSGKS